MKSISELSGEIKLPETFTRELKDIAKRKKGNQILAHTYDKTCLWDCEEKALKLRTCGKTIIYAENPTGGNPIQVSALRCQLRLCPSCSWIRAQKIFWNVYSIITDKAFCEKQFIFLTLTIKNCLGEYLDREIRCLLSAWDKLAKPDRPGFGRSFLGTFRALEVTYNPITKTYHPHLHAMAAVERDYFKKSNKNYINQAKLRELWRDACGLDYLPQCRIERVRNSTGKQIAEVAKYTVKSSDYLTRPEVVETLDKALFRKRLIAYGGLFREVKKRLDLPDEDNVTGNDFPRQTVEELLQNPYIRKIVLEWKMGSYHVSLMRQSADPADWMRPDRFCAAALSRSATAWKNESNQ